MLKNKVVMEICRNDRTYSMHIDPNAPLGELHDVLLDMKNLVIQKINEESKRDKPLQSISNEENPCQSQE